MMCNPRRVQVTATRQVREAWEREVRRAASVSTRVGAAARIRQALDASVGAPALMALQLRLANGCPGWVGQPDGAYRCEVEGGHVLFRPDDRSLEIVATLTETIEETGSASRTLSGTLETRIETSAEAGWYEDGWGGHTEIKARADARRAAEHQAEAAVRARIEAQASAAEQQAEADLTSAAQAAARERLEDRAQVRRADLEQRARERLDEVGIRARQAFHRLLALAYRDALEGLARRRGVAAADIATTDTDEYLEIEFQLPD